MPAYLQACPGLGGLEALFLFALWRHICGRILRSALQDARIFTGVSWPWGLGSSKSLYAHPEVSASAMPAYLQACPGLGGLGTVRVFMRILRSAPQDARIFTGVSWPWGLGSSKSLHAHPEVSASGCPHIYRRVLALGAQGL